MKQLFNVLREAIQRCENKNNKNYKDYGARGITVCKEWKENQESFCKWSLENGYKIGLKIDRKNNDLGYSHDNCRWVTQEIQSRNTRRIYSHNKSGYRGVSWSKQHKKWRTTIKAGSSQVHLGLFKCKLDAARVYDNYVIENRLEHTRNFS